MAQADLDDVEEYLVNFALRGNRRVLAGWLRKRFAELRARQASLLGP
jgi:hypothetical protein